MPLVARLSLEAFQFAQQVIPARLLCRGAAGFGCLATGGGGTSCRTIASQEAEGFAEFVHGEGFATADAGSPGGEFGDGVWGLGCHDA